MKNKGFTLIELLVVISIIVILTGIVFAGYRTGQQQLALQRAANKLAQDIRRTGGMALAAEKIPGGEIPPGGYGIYFGAVNDTYYKLYGDTSPDPPNEKYNSGDQEIETINMEQGIKISQLISQLIPTSSLSINFKPPDPAIMLAGDSGIGEVTITICLISDTSKTKTVTVNKAGLIEID